MTALTSTTELTPQTTFAKLGVRDEIVRALAEKGIERPFAIQELTLPLALAGEDVIGQARTGMGKTFAFGVPLLQRITAGAGVRPLTGAPRALVVVPTRELCLQVTDDLATAAKHLTAEGGRPLSVVRPPKARPGRSGRRARTRCAPWRWVGRSGTRRGTRTGAGLGWPRR